MRQFVVLLIFSSLLQIGCSKVEEKEIVKNVTNLEKPQISQSNASASSETPSKYVSDEQTAIDIAVKAWIPKFGKKQIEDEKPYHATLKNGVWIVTGSLPKSWNVGGVAMANILQKDGRVLEIAHSK